MPFINVICNTLVRCYVCCIKKESCAWQVARRSKQIADKLNQDLDLDEEELESLRLQMREQMAVTMVDDDVQSWWPQEQSVSELALQMAVLVEALGSSPSLGDWALVRPLHLYQ